MAVGKDLLYSRPKQQHLNYFVWEAAEEIWDHNVNLNMSTDILKTVWKDVFWSGGESLPRISAALFPVSQMPI